MTSKQGKKASGGFAVLRPLHHSNVDLCRIHAGVVGTGVIVKPTGHSHEEHNKSAAIIAELNEKLKLSNETNADLTSRLKSSETRLVKLTNAKSHLVRKLRESLALQQPKENIPNKSAVYDALMESLQSLQLEHDDLAKKYHATKKEQETMTLRTRQVSELQSETKRLRRIHTLEAKLLDLFRDVTRSQKTDHSRYSPLGKAIRMAERDLATALGEEP